MKKGAKLKKEKKKKVSVGDQVTGDGLVNLIIVMLQMFLDKKDDLKKDNYNLISFHSLLK